MLYYGAACGLGILAGAAFAWLWLRVVPPGTNRRFWSAMSGLTREMLQVEEGSEFLRLYRRLGILTGAYLARNLGGTAVACLPMIAILLSVGTLVFEAWDAKAQRVIVAPASAAQYVSPPSPRVAERMGYCSSAGYCALFAALDFKVIEIKQDLPYAVVRADHGDVNPFWPFLSDIEAAFLAAFVLSTIFGLLWPSLKRRS
jgi:hypothetical protein